MSGKGPFDSFPDINGDGKHDAFDIFIADTVMKEVEKKEGLKPSGLFGCHNEDGGEIF